MPHKHLCPNPYVPSHKHTSFTDIPSHVATCIDTGKLFKWIKKNQKRVAANLELKKLLGHQI